MVHVAVKFWLLIGNYFFVFSWSCEDIFNAAPSSIAKILANKKKKIPAWLWKNPWTNVWKEQFVGSLDTTVTHSRDTFFELIFLFNPI